MKPMIKPKRTAAELAEEDAVRQQHKANPVKKNRPQPSIARALQQF
jgi:hypothetical protein